MAAVILSSNGTFRYTEPLARDAPPTQKAVGAPLVAPERARHVSFQRSVVRARPLNPTVRPSRDMSQILSWPSEFADPTPVTDFDTELVDLFDELIAMGISVHADSHWSLFGFERGSRMIDFVRRGRARTGLTGATINREIYWEVWPVCDGSSVRLGPLFGLEECTAIVICGLASIHNATVRWLDRRTILETMTGIDCWDRSNTESPLRIKPEKGANK